ncbi:hypothetical protein ZWY2020_040400 [Hordeum vulgare]|nr:hypothetical protein ZWY2020_040400 [Hordeum vulgare]
MGRVAIAAVSRARGMELAGAIDTQCIGMDAGELGIDKSKMHQGRNIHNSKSSTYFFCPPSWHPINVPVLDDGANQQLPKRWPSYCDCFFVDEAA